MTKQVTGQLKSDLSESVNIDDLETVYVFPDGDNYLDEDTEYVGGTPEWKSDDYETRKTTLCKDCDTVLHISHGEPIASCDCGDREWQY